MKTRDLNAVEGKKLNRQFSFKEETVRNPICVDSLFLHSGY